MNILIDRLPESVEIGGVEYPINFGFRALILCEICIYDDRLTEEQKMLNVLNIFYKGRIPGDIEKATEMFLWFHGCGHMDEDKPKKGATVKSRRYYDFEQDAPYIYAAYKSQYGIDLQDIAGDEFHWWKFRALFLSLNEDTRISKIMNYRSASLNGMSKEMKAHYKEMKALYAIKDAVKVDDKMKLAKRNQQMLDYVRNRHQKCL